MLWLGPFTFRCPTKRKKASKNERHLRRLADESVMESVFIMHTQRTLARGHHTQLAGAISSVLHHLSPFHYHLQRTQRDVSAQTSVHPQWSWSVLLRIDCHIFAPPWHNDLDRGCSQTWSCRAFCCRRRRRSFPSNALSIAPNWHTDSDKLSYSHRLALNAEDKNEK